MDVYTSVVPFQKMSSILKQAKEVIRTSDRWTKRMYRDEKGRVCAIGAVNTVTPMTGATEADIWRIRDLRDEARFALLSVTPPAWDTVPGYNDYPGTSHEDIMRMFDEAIEIAEINEQESER